MNDEWMNDDRQANSPFHWSNCWLIAFVCFCLDDGIWVTRQDVVRPQRCSFSLFEIQKFANLSPGPAGLSLGEGQMKSLGNSVPAVEASGAAEPVVDNEMHPQKNGFYIKFALLISFIAADAYLNSKTEYEAMEMDGKSSIDELSQLQMVLFGSTIILQLSIASSIFLILCNTFPFQVGVMFPFLKGIFKLFLVLQPAYMILSCAVGGMRLVRTCVFQKTSSKVMCQWTKTCSSSSFSVPNIREWQHRFMGTLVLFNAFGYAQTGWVCPCRQMHSHARARIWAY